MAEFHISAVAHPKSDRLLALDRVEVDVLVIGAGVAGLSVAHAINSRHVTLLSAEPISAAGSTAWAQGGMAAALPPEDSAAEHARDTLAAGAGACDVESVRILTEEAADAVTFLGTHGVVFDRSGDHLLKGREAAHSRARILHCNGDATGAGIQTGLAHDLQDKPSLDVATGMHIVRLLVDRGRVHGAVAVPDQGRPIHFAARDVVLATGGCGQLYGHTTNPACATGDGLAMAMACGARTAALAFMQFHPTAIAVAADPLPLATEALRGAGAVLRRPDSKPVMASVHPAGDLAPRDIVARALCRAIENDGDVYLDATQAVGASFSQRFPTVYRSCKRHAIDPVHEWIPVTPAAHFHMGGVVTDYVGATSLGGLWAVGEVACTGVHGANRLASNSMLEGVVFGRRVAAALDRGGTGKQVESNRQVVAGDTDPVDRDAMARLRVMMWHGMGLVRDAHGLQALLRSLFDLRRELPETQQVLKRRLTLAQAMAQDALSRRESRGGHFRSDFPHAMQFPDPHAGPWAPIALDSGNAA